MHTRRILNTASNLDVMEEDNVDNDENEGPTQFVRDVHDGSLSGLLIQREFDGDVCLKLVGDETLSEEHSFNLPDLIEGILRAVGSDQFAEAISEVHNRLQKAGSR